MVLWSRSLGKNGVRTGFFKKEVEIFNQLINEFLLKI